MKAIIIAAGYGKRMSPDYNQPKGLLDINGKSILERQISMFRKNGIKDIVIVTGPFTNFEFEDVSYVNDSNYSEHDVLGSLMAARDEIRGEVITSYSDLLFEESILKKTIEFSGKIGITVDLNWKLAYENRTQHPLSEADNVLLKNNKILKIQKEIVECENDEIMGEFLGLMKLSSNGSKIFVDSHTRLIQNHKGSFHKAPSLKKAYLTDMLQELIDSNVDVSPIIVKGQWIEIDTLQDLEKARMIFF